MFHSIHPPYICRLHAARYIGVQHSFSAEHIACDNAITTINWLVKRNWSYRGQEELNPIAEQLEWYYKWYYKSILQPLYHKSSRDISLPSPGLNRGTQTSLMWCMQRNFAFVIVAELKCSNKRSIMMAYCTTTIGGKFHNSCCESHEILISYI